MLQPAQAGIGETLFGCISIQTRKFPLAENNTAFPILLLSK